MRHRNEKERTRKEERGVWRQETCYVSISRAVNLFTTMATEFATNGTTTKKKCDS